MRIAYLSYPTSKENNQSPHPPPKYSIDISSKLIVPIMLYCNETEDNAPSCEKAKFPRVLKWLILLWLSLGCACTYFTYQIKSAYRETCNELDRGTYN